ncbi:DNA mismatch repair endonuclease MutL [Allomuricauda sp. d1]|uniref:DNA mismatch repair endonuclease MutL n=1 Tax=Allomuricauda sp. d1 TaxID=3136725 RepID=UPI0031D82A0C
MADIIKLLPDHVANQIAAGEVVQRPASVVKELLENAIDAGATQVKLIVKDGGKSLIQVVDNGVGMSTTDARLSFERHATSKIKSADDLFNLQTKGFRGEALASIAAISHVEMQTKTETDELGTRLKIEGSKMVSQEPITTQKGTSILVKNLFYNIPARRNFLKSNQVELRHITDEFHRVALVHPDIEFHFYNNGAELFNLSETTYRKRISNVIGSKMVERLVPVHEETDVVNISGFICKPEFAKKSRGEQFFFANGRFIKSPYLHHAVVSAFEGLIKPDTYPGYFLYLNVDPSTVDINIHPTKTEVKFENEHALYAMLRSTVKHALGQFNVAPVLDFEHDPNLDTPYDYVQKEAVLPRVTVDRGFNPFEQKSTQPMPARPSVKGWENLYAGLSTDDRQSFSSLEFESESEQKTFEGDYLEHARQTPTFQLHRKYIVTTIKSGMLVIDQHRAHQRILYEKFLKEITVQEGVSQQLLFPIEVKFSKKELTVLNEIKDSLANIGFIFEDVKKDNRVKLSGVPSIMAEHQIASFLDGLISEYQEGRSHGGTSQAELLAHLLSKNLAIRNGEPLEQESQEALVNDLFSCKEPMLSPSKKKTYITLLVNDIEKRFL